MTTMNVRSGHVRVWLGIVLAFMGGSAAGVWFGAQLFTVRVMVDYASGAVWRRMSIGPFLVRMERDASFLPIDPLAETQSEGKALWHTALVFRGPMDDYSPLLRSSVVLQSLRLLESVRCDMSVKERTVVNRRFLEFLSSNDVNGACRYVESLAEEEQANARRAGGIRAEPLIVPH